MRIFISYASKNRELVRKLADDLNDLGHEVWFDRELSGGQQWWEEILNSIRECDLFIFALTQESLDSVACKREYTYASQLNKRIMPVLMADLTITVLPSELAHIQYVDYRQADKKATIAFNRALNMLPPPQPQPDPLPVPPPVPVSPLSEIRAQIDVPSLTVDEQRLLVAKLADYVKEPDTANDARALLRRLRQRDDLLAKVDREISVVLRNGNDYTSSPRLFLHNSQVWGTRFTPDGKRIATVNKENDYFIIRLWDIATGEVTIAFNQLEVPSYINISSDGKLLVTSSSEGYFVVWDIDKCARICEFDVGGSVSPLNQGIEFLSNNEFVTSVYVEENHKHYEIQKIDLRTGRILRKISLRSGESRFAFIPNSHQVILSSGRRIKIVDPFTNEEIYSQRLDDDFPEICNAIMSPDHKFILLGRAGLPEFSENGLGERGLPIAYLIELNDKNEAEPRIKRLVTKEFYIPFDSWFGFQVTKGLFSFELAFSNDSKLALVVGHDRRVRIWSTITGWPMEMNVNANDNESTSFSPNDQQIATVYNEGDLHYVAIWNLGQMHAIHKDNINQYYAMLEKERRDANPSL